MDKIVETAKRNGVDWLISSLQRKYNDTIDTTELYDMNEDATEATQAPSTTNTTISPPPVPRFAIPLLSPNRNQPPPPPTHTITSPGDNQVTYKDLASALKTRDLGHHQAKLESLGIESIDQLSLLNSPGDANDFFMSLPFPEKKRMKLLIESLSTSSSTVGATSSSSNEASSISIEPPPLPVLSPKPLDADEQTHSEPSKRRASDNAQTLEEIRNLEVSLGEMQDKESDLLSELNKIRNEITRTQQRIEELRKLSREPPRRNITPPPIPKQESSKLFQKEESAKSTSFPSYPPIPPLQTSSARDASESTSTAGVVSPKSSSFDVTSPASPPAAVISPKSPPTSVTSPKPPPPPPNPNRLDHSVPAASPLPQPPPVAAPPTTTAPQFKPPPPPIPKHHDPIPQAAPSGKSDTPCNNFQLDMSGSTFGVCICGHAKAKHGQNNSDSDNPFKKFAKMTSTTQVPAKTTEAPAIIKPPPPPIPNQTSIAAHKEIEEVKSEDDNATKKRQNYSEESTALPPPPPAPAPATSVVSDTEQEAEAEIDWKTRLVNFYEIHNPSKLDTIDQVLKKYKGKETELFKELEKKYPGSTKQY